MIAQYIKQALIVENPIKSLRESKNDYDYLDTVYSDVAVNIAEHIIDGLNSHHALLYVLDREFGREDIDPSRLQNCITRISMLNTVLKDNPEKDILK